MDKKREWTGLIIGFLGSVLGLYGVIVCNHLLSILLPPGVMMVCTPVVYWLIAVIPIVMMIIYKDKLTDLGFVKEKPGYQILVGVLVAMGMSFVLTVIPYLVGWGKFIYNDDGYQNFWQYVYEFVYCIAAVGAAEEFVFRGYIYSKVKQISNREGTAIVVSSVLFGIFHIFNGSLFQVIMTSFIGVIFCLCRVKIKGCSTLSLIIAHGIYDALIPVWAAIIS